MRGSVLLRPISAKYVEALLGQEYTCLMPFNEALFWFGLTAAGTGFYYLFEASVKRPLLHSAVTVIGVLACAYSVYHYHHPESPAIHLWMILLILTWALVGYSIYISRRVRHFEFSPPPEIDEATRQSVAYQNKLIELGRNIDGVLNPVQIEAIQLSTKLLEFVKGLGNPPAPKYTREQYDKMPSSEMKKLIQAEDGDWIEACTYYGTGDFQLSTQGYSNQIIARCNRLLPWYEKVRARYALEFQQQVENLRNRFAIEGMSDHALTMPVQGRDGIKTIKAIASKLWELAYTVTEKRNQP